MISVGILNYNINYLNKIINILNYKGIKICIYNSLHLINQEIDFLLLDIDMPDKDGIKYLKEQQNIKIVFITKHNVRHKQCYGSNIYEYVSRDNLEIELTNKIIETINIIKINHLVTFRVNGVDIIIKMDDIVYCQYIGGRIVSIIYGNKCIDVKNNTFNTVMNKLDDRFIEINRGIAINKNKIKTISNDVKYMYLNNINCKFEISVRKRNLVKQYYYEIYK